MKYKILFIIEKDLVNTLEKEAKLGFEPIKWLGENAPNQYSDDRSYKILLVKRE